ncbi:eCIS core domain-containing protein [Caballeronia udeis]|uniref:eCIS core domain-containing protein n=1 Tax=Caballeronia udeis TaxID=1232866 RepID=UPI0018D46EB6|nr:DUF4157 domain-containing protein [Caballeronia udeis]
MQSIPGYQIADACIKNIERCPQYIVSSIPSLAIQPIIDSYKAHLFSQANGKWQPLPAWFVNQFSKNYPEISLSQIRYAEGIDTVHGQNITLGYHVFLVGAVSLGTRSGNQLMLHELQHTVQWVQRGGEQPFLSEYILHSAGQIIANRSINVHDSVSFERDAIGKANQMIDNLGWMFLVKNSCEYPINISISYFDNTISDYKTTSFYTVRAGGSIIPVNGDGPLHTTHGSYYYYASAIGRNLEWGGGANARKIVIGDISYFFRAERETGAPEAIVVELTCPR